jgi:three-Cys-motif partner protein
MEKTNAKVWLLEHSEAKIALYGTYLATYLNILHRVPKVKKILLFDLLCGEGRYVNGGKGSPIIALETIQRHYHLNGETCPNIAIWFNDSEFSEIDKGSYKVDRVKHFASSILLPPTVTIEYFKEDYDLVHERAVKKAQSTQFAKSLFFIDPYGYKEIPPEHIRNTLVGGNSEVLLFVPVSHMYRFASSVTRATFPGSMPLTKFLDELFKGSIPTFDSPYDFIAQIKVKFREYLKDLRVYVDTFVIERDNCNVYALFFFTSSIVGFEKMIESKWAVDPTRGLGFTHNQTTSLFNPIELSEYPEKLRAFIESDTYRSNKQVYEFGLQEGFLPKHSHRIMKEWLETRSDFKIFSLDGKPTRTSSTYLADKERVVAYRFEKVQQY